MRAGDVATPYPTVGMDTPAVEAARLLAGRNLPGLIVVDEVGRPITVLPGTEVLRLAIPAYYLDDPALARVVDEAAADLFLRGVDGSTVAECLPQVPRELPVVQPKATVLEVAAVMARARSPLVAVALDGEPMLGAITLDSLLDRMLAA